MTMPGGDLTDEDFEKFRSLIYRVSGIQIATNKKLMITNRLRRRVRETKLPGFAEYYAFLTSPAGGREMPLFLDEITTNETYFYRDPPHYEWFAGTFLPEIARQAHARKRPRRLRIWSAACSTGEELYSLSIKIMAARGLFPNWPIQLLGTDLSGSALEEARAGTYDERAVRLVGAAERSAYFTHDAQSQRWTVRPEVRAMASWKRHNLLFPLREEPFDCIFLKNVLIYFDVESKKAVLKNLLPLLARGGFLVAGPTEGIYKMLDPLDQLKSWLFQRPEDPRSGGG
ncbi:MAG: chemotaxis protein [Planctomycetes bacterium SCN 63-9]|nr:MAG: chemotaxis protein [Planctomycetes bacterium SCN 63-9]